MAFDAQLFITELNKAGQLSEEQLEVLQGAVRKPEVSRYLEESYLRQADYSRGMNSLREKEIATSQLQTQLVQWKSDQEKIIERANLSAKQEREARAALEVKVREVAATYGIPEAEIMSAPAAAPPPAAPVVQTQDFVARADWEKEMGQLRSSVPFLPTMIHDLDVRHQKLYGERLPDSTGLMREVIEAGGKRSLEEVWKDKYKVADREAQIQEEAIQVRIKQGVEAAVGKLRSEQSLPTPIPTMARSPILSQFAPQPKDRSNMDGVEAAVADFSTRLADAASTGA